MKWTDKKPTKEGWYWCNIMWNHIVYLEHSFHGLMWYEPYEAENDDGCLETYQEPKYLYDEECKWAGPIKEPI